MTQTYGTSLEALMGLRPTHVVEIDTSPVVVHKMAASIPVTDEALADGRALARHLHESFRRSSLAMLGFLGSVRCARCRRRLRCVWAEVDGRHYGRDCYLATFGGAA